MGLIMPFRTIIFIFLFQWSCFSQIGTTPTAQVKTLSDLLTNTIPVINNRLTAIVTGRVTTNDGGGGIYIYESSNITSTNLGTIAKPSTATGRWSMLYSGPLNIKWFGAVGDGTANDTAAFTNAIALTQVSGGAIFIPKGTYLVDGLSITQDGVSIHGESTGYQYGGSGGTTNVSVLKASSSATTVLTIGGTANQLNTHISNIAIDGNRTATTGIKAFGLPIIERVSIYHCAEGLVAGSLNGSVFRNVAAYDNGTGLIITNTATTSTKYLVESCNFRQNTNYGGIVQDGQSSKFLQTDFEANGKNGLRVYKPTGETLSRVVFDTCFFENNGGANVGDDSYQLLVDSQTLNQTTGPPSYLLFDHCTLNGNGTQGGAKINSDLYGRYADCKFNAAVNALTTSIYCSGTEFFARSGGGALAASAFEWAPSFANGAGGFIISGNLDSYTNTVTRTLAGSGSAAEPSFSFSGDLDTGIYRAASNEIDFVNQGTNFVSIVAAGTVVSSTPTAVTGFQISDRDGFGGNHYVGLKQDPNTSSGSSRFYRNLTAASTAGPVVQIYQDHATDDQPGLEIIQDGSGPAISSSGDVITTLAGKGFKVKEGADARMGTAVLNGASPSTVTVANTSVTANTRIFLTINTAGAAPGVCYVSARTGSTSFTITGANTDTSTVAWILLEPSP